MTHSISDTHTPAHVPNTVRVTSHLYGVIGMASKQDWASLFLEFRFNLQNRIAGSDDRELLKLQAKIENVNELDQFFQSLISTPPKR